MVNKKFVVFRVAAIIALLITSGIFMFLFYFIFSDKTIAMTNNNHIVYIIILFFLLLAGTAFQVQNIWLVTYAKKDDLPLPYFIISHTILLIFNFFGTIGIGIVLYSMVLELCHQGTTSIIILLFCAIWFLSNLISIIGSLNMRHYLHIRQIRRERALLDNFGK